MKLSRYAIPFEKNGTYLLYFSRTNAFYALNSQLYKFLVKLKESANELQVDTADDTICFLMKENIIIHDTEDQDYIDSLLATNQITEFGNPDLRLTITPTLQCNLRCPYCFEESKPLGFMSSETIDKLYSFVDEHVYAKTYSITWFGGEPLLGLKQMKAVTEKLQQLKDKNLLGTSIVTNATLLNDEAIEFFQHYPLSTMQITLDGNKEQHDSKRYNAAGKGSFDMILNNVDRAISALPNTRFSFRINVDNTNRESFIEVANMLKDRYHEHKNMTFYAGILRANKGCESEQFFSTKDHIEFAKQVYNAGLSNDLLYPAYKSKGCTATCTSSYVIGPLGEIYLCWEHVGKKDKIVGNIADKQLSNPILRNRFLIHGTCLNDEKCLKCALLPICTGGCPNKRIENLYENSDHNLCALYKDNNFGLLTEILYEYYLAQQAL